MTIVCIGHFHKWQNLDLCPILCPQIKIKKEDWDDTDTMDTTDPMDQIYFINEIKIAGIKTNYLIQVYFLLLTENVPLQKKHNPQ